MPSAAALLAHQGGWDEALFVAVPMAVLVGLLALAQRRAGEERDAESGVATTEPGAERGAQSGVATTEPDER